MSKETDQQFIAGWMKKINLCKTEAKNNRSLKWGKYREYIDEDRMSTKKKKYYYVNYAKYITDILRATVYPRGSETIVVPTFNYGTDKDMSHIVYHIMNYMPYKINLKFQDKLTIQDVGIYGTGFQKMGWDKDNGGFWCERISPENIFVDFNCNQDLDNGKWIIHYEDYMVEEISEKYKIAKDKIKPNTYYMFDENDRDTYKDDPDAQMVTVYEIEDRKNDEFVLFCEGYDKPIDRYDRPYKMKESIYTPLKFNEPLDGFWGIPMLQYLEPQMEEKWEIVNDMSEERKTGKRKIFINGQILDNSKNADKAIKSNKSDAVIICTSPPGAGQVYIANPTSNVFFDREDLMMRDQELKEMSGVSPYKYSQMQRVRYSSEVDASREEGGLRDDEKIDIVYDFKNTQLRKAWKIIQQYATKDWVEKVIGYGRLTDYHKTYMQFDWKDKSKIEGEYDLKLNFSSVVPITHNQRKREIADLMGILSKISPDQLPFNVDQMKILWRYMINTFQIPEVEQTIEGAEDNMEVQTKVFEKLFQSFKDNPQALKDFVAKIQGQAQPTEQLPPTEQVLPPAVGGV